MDINQWQPASASQKRLYILFTLSVTSSIRGQTIYTKLSAFCFCNYFHRCWLIIEFGGDVFSLGCSCFHNTWYSCTYYLSSLEDSLTRTQLIAKRIACKFRKPFDFLILWFSRAFFKTFPCLFFLFVFREKFYTIFIQTPRLFVGEIHSSLHLFIEHFSFESAPLYN